MEHYDPTDTQNYQTFSTNYSVQNSRCWNKPYSDPKSSTSDPSNFNRHHKQIDQEFQNPNFPKRDELPKVYTSSHKTNYGFNPSTKGASFEKDQTKYEEEMDYEMAPEQTKQTRSAYTRTVIELVSGMPRPTINNRNPKDSSKFSTKHTSQFGNNSTKSSENCHSCNKNQSSRSNQNSADRGDNDGKQTDSKSVTKQNDLSNSDRPYPTVKTRLKNVFTNLKNSIEAHSLELEHIFQDIIKEKELSFQERQELLTLWKEYTTCLESIEKKIRNKQA
ncbi:hypothetical protein Zmor_022863 [Zophobas morio]|uniref:Uncharacterized protein n=1 Tax=Zophobas morio TaxID=2755281 RepID=A0AA38HX16_9CUCU|nr:hypothetical protein Zmor_022863 [Zophobas morio]